MHISNPFTFLILKSAGGSINKSTGTLGAATIHSGPKISLEVNEYVSIGIYVSYLFLSVQNFILHLHNTEGYP